MLGGEWPLRQRSRGLRGLAARRRAGQGRRVSLAGTLVGGIAGFLLGAAFWVILGLDHPKGAGVSPAWEPDCTVLTLDRHQGHTTAGPCFGYAPPRPLRQADAGARP